MTTITTPTYIYRCQSDELAPGILVCRATGYGEMFSDKRRAAFVCPNCGEALVMDDAKEVRPPPARRIEQAAAQPLLIAPVGEVAEQLGLGE